MPKHHDHQLRMENNPILLGSFKVLIWQYFNPRVNPCLCLLLYQSVSSSYMSSFECIVFDCASNWAWISRYKWGPVMFFLSKFSWQMFHVIHFGPQLFEDSLKDGTNESAFKFNNRKKQRLRLIHDSWVDLWTHKHVQWTKRGLISHLLC